MKLPIVQLALTVRFERSFHKPDYAGSLLRGQFGRMLKQRLCITKVHDCSNCAVVDNCQAVRLFDAPGNNMPAPYVIHDPLWGEMDIPAGMLWQFSHTLIGEYASRQAVLIVQQWGQVCQKGFGTTRTSARLISVTDHTGTLIGRYEHGQLRRLAVPGRLSWPESLGNGPIQITLTTPLRLFFQNRQIRPQHFQPEHFFKALWHRLQALSHASYGFDRILRLDARTRQALFDSRLEIHTLGWRRLKRYSTRQQAEQDMSGLIGQFTIQPVNKEVARLIWFGQQVHIGKNTVFGLGHYEARFSDRL